MDFFGIGPLELIVILLLTFLVLGPTRLPQASRTIGRTLRRLQQSTSQLRDEFTRGLDVEDAVEFKPDQPGRESASPGDQRG